MRRWLALVALGFASGPAFAQATGEESAEMRHFGGLLRERSRVTMNRAEEPLTVIGLEQGDNDLRSRTPALLKCEHAPTLLDPKAAYERALAMYEDEEIFHSPPPTLVTPAAAEAAPEAGASEPDEPTSVAPPFDYRHDWRTVLPSMLLGALVVSWLFRRTARSMRWPAAAGLEAHQR